MRDYNLIRSPAALSGHNDVRALCSHSGQLVSAGYDGLVNVWDVSRSAPLHMLGDGSAGPTFAVCDIPNLGLLASAGQDGVIRLWDVNSGAVVSKLEGGHVGSVCALLSRGKHHELFSGGSDEHVLAWDLRSRQGTTSLRGHASSTRCLALGANDLLYAAGGDGRVRAWSCRRGAKSAIQAYTRVEELCGPLYPVSALAYDGPRALLSAAGMDNVIHCWDTLVGAEGGVRVAAKELTGHSGVVNALLAWGDRGLLSASADGTMRVWDTSMGDRELAAWRTFQVGEGVAAASLRALHALDSARVCVGDSSGRITVWQAVDAGQLQ